VVQTKKKKEKDTAKVEKGGCVHEMVDIPKGPSAEKKRAGAKETCGREEAKKRRGESGGPEAAAHSFRVISLGEKSGTKEWRRYNTESPAPRRREEV